MLFEWASDFEGLDAPTGSKIFVAAKRAVDTLNFRRLMSTIVDVPHR